MAKCFFSFWLGGTLVHPANIPDHLLGAGWTPLPTTIEMRQGLTQWGEALLICIAPPNGAVGGAKPYFSISQEACYQTQKHEVLRMAVTGDCQQQHSRRQGEKASLKAGRSSSLGGLRLGLPQIGSPMKQRTEYASNTHRSKGDGARLFPYPNPLALSFSHISIGGCCHWRTFVARDLPRAKPNCGPSQLLQCWFSFPFTKGGPIWTSQAPLPGLVSLSRVAVRPKSPRQKLRCGYVGFKLWQEDTQNAF